MLRCKGRLAGVLIVCLGGSVWVFAEPAKTGDTDVVDSLDWMAGAWRGELFGGPLEEHWSGPRGGAMIGMSRMGAERERAMYEFMLIERKGDGVFLYLRHFRGGLTTGEKEPMRYKLTESGRYRAVFATENKKLSIATITYELAPSKMLVVRLEGERNGKPVRHESRMKRLPDPSLPIK